MSGKNELQAIIWDMDGVLVDSNEFHFQAWQEIYRQFSDDQKPLAKSRFEALFGMRNDQTVIRLFGADLASTAFIETVSAEKEALFRQMIRGRIKPLDGILSWLSYFFDHGYGLAVASSAPELNIQAILRELQVSPYFSVILSGEESPQLASKPAPDIFLEAARRLKASPARCLVIEDSLVGVEAAGAAGMACLAVTTTHNTGALAAADWVVDNFEQLLPQTMAEMWAG